MIEWMDESNTPLAIVQDTDITFVVHHPYKAIYDKGDLAMKRWYQDIQSHENGLRAYLTNHNPYPAETAELDGWDRWRIIPEEEYPFCPACQPEEYRNHQHSKTIASPSST
jgi:hypothetical protein